MSRKNLAIALLVPFLVLTGYAVWKVGYVGIFDYHRHSPAGWQVFTDLVIPLILVLMFIVPEAKAKGRAVWLWILLTLTLGSIGPLLFLATSKPRVEGERSAA